MEWNDKSYRSMFTQLVWVFSGTKRVLYGIPHPMLEFCPLHLLWKVLSVGSFPVLMLLGSRDISWMFGCASWMLRPSFVVVQPLPAGHFQRPRVSATVTGSSLIFGEVESQ